MYVDKLSILMIQTDTTTHLGITVTYANFNSIIYGNRTLILT